MTQCDLGDQKHQPPLGNCQKCTFLGPTLYPLNQNSWWYSHWALTNPPGNSHRLTCEDHCSKRQSKLNFLNFLHLSGYILITHTHTYKCIYTIFFFLLKELLYTLCDAALILFKCIISHMSFHFCTSCLRRL